MKNLLIGCMAAFAVFMGLTGCEQEAHVYTGPNYLMFSDTLYTYGVQDNEETFKLPVIATKACDHDRNFAVEIIDKKSNAIEGKHYRLLSNTATIKAGEVLGNIEIQGIYDNIEAGDSLRFTLRLVIPEEEQWEMYGIETGVMIQKVCPFDINNFTGYCMVTSTYYMQYMSNVTSRLIKSELVEGEENTIVLRDYYYDGFDIKISFDNEDVLEPAVEMEAQVCGDSGEAFGMIYGDGKLRMEQPDGYLCYFSTCENFVMQYATVYVDNKDGSTFGVVGTYINLIEWISDAEAEKLKEQGY